MTTPAPARFIHEPASTLLKVSLTNNATPANPMNTPSNTFAFGRLRLSPQFNITTHKGSLATSNAANPDAMYFSAQLTPPLPHSNSKPPTMSALRHCDNEGRTFSPFNPAQVKSIPPAIKNLVAAARNGGRVSIV